MNIIMVQSLQTCEEMFQMIMANTDPDLSYSVEVYPVIRY